MPFLTKAPAPGLQIAPPFADLGYAMEDLDQLLADVDVHVADMDFGALANETGASSDASGASTGGGPDLWPSHANVQKEDSAALTPEQPRLTDDPAGTSSCGLFFDTSHQSIDAVVMTFHRQFNISDAVLQLPHQAATLQVPDQPLLLLDERTKLQMLEEARGEIDGAVIEFLEFANGGNSLDEAAVHRSVEESYRTDTSFYNAVSAKMMSGMGTVIPNRAGPEWQSFHLGTNLMARKVMLDRFYRMTATHKLSAASV
jgi:hypothetical protein